MNISLRVSATANGAHGALPTARLVRRSHASVGASTLQDIYIYIYIYTHMYTYIYVYNMYISLMLLAPVDGAHGSLPTVRPVRSSHAPGGARAIQGTYTHTYIPIHRYILCLYHSDVQPQLLQALPILPPLLVLVSSSSSTTTTCTSLVLVLVTSSSTRSAIVRVLILVMVLL